MSTEYQVIIPIRLTQSKLQSVRGWKSQEGSWKYSMEIQDHRKMRVLVPPGSEKVEESMFSNQVQNWEKIKGKGTTRMVESKRE